MNTNACIFTGNLTKKPVLRYTATGKAVTSFTMAVNGLKKEDDPLFMDCVVWEGLAETVSSNLDKGSKVLVGGRLNSRKWSGDDGVERRKVELQVRDLEFLTPKSANGKAPADAATQQ